VPRESVEIQPEALATALPSELQLIGSAIASLIRGDSRDLDPFLHVIETHTAMTECSGVYHCHAIRLDGNGRVRLRDLMAYLASTIVDYAVPRSKINEAYNQFVKTNSTAALVRLARQAQQLFVDLAKTGEGGELLLFLFAEKYLRLPQVLCKMNLKTSGAVHFHGSDGIHIGVKSSGQLELYWCESKVYSTMASGLSACLKSLAEVLTSTRSEQSRDLQLVGDYADLDSAGLENALRRFLNPNNAEFNDVEFCGLCLVGFDSDAYPTYASKKTMQAVIEAVETQSAFWKRILRSDR
jgi:hypothetical protein